MTYREQIANLFLLSFYPEDTQKKKKIEFSLHNELLKNILVQLRGNIREETTKCGTLVTARMEWNYWLTMGSNPNYSLCVPTNQILKRNFNKYMLINDFFKLPILILYLFNL